MPILMISDYKGLSPSINARWQNTLRWRVRLLAASVLLASTTMAAPWRFVVCGDTRGEGGASDPYYNPTILPEIASAVANMSPQPAFLLVPGDLINSGSLAGFRAWTNVMSPVYAAGIPIYPVLGNHDDNDVTSYKAVFAASIPNNGPSTEIDRTYFIAYSNVLILNLDTYVTSGQVNQSWINAVLATNTRPHIFAQGHMPAFKANHADCLDDYPTQRNTFWNSLSDVHCRIYFAGHDHFYNHAQINDGDGNATNDVHQMIVGTGGAPAYTSYAYDGDNNPYTPQLVYSEYENGYVVVEIDGYSATTTWYHRTGANSYVATSEMFSYTLPVVCPTFAYSFDGGHLTLTWTNGVLQEAPDVAGTYTDVLGAVSPFVVTDLSAAQKFYRARAY